MNWIWTALIGFFGVLSGHIFGKIVSDSLPNMHYKKLPGYIKTGLVTVRFLVVFKILILLKKYGKLSPELEKQLNLVYLVAGIIILFAALQKWSEENKQNRALGYTS